MEQDLRDVNFLVYNRFADKGLNVDDDPEFVDDNELTEAVNVVYDYSLISPRSGSRLLIPALGANSEIKLIKAITSDGKEFLLRYWGTNLELYDEANRFFIKLNQTFNFTSGYGFSYANWLNGYGSDKLYGGNSRNSTISWHITLNYTSQNLNGGENSIPLQDASRFPSSGKIVLKHKTSGQEFVRDYSSKSGNNLVLTSGQTAPALPAGSSVCMTASQLTSLPNGDIYLINQRRLFVANSFGNETRIFYSQINNPENFAGTGIPGGGSEYIPDGEGAIKGIIDLVDYLIIIKENVYQKFSFVFNSSLDSKIVSITPIISGNGIGFVNNNSVVKVFNSLFGFSPDGNVIKIDGITTGSNTSIKINKVSKKIYPILKNLDFKNSVGVFFDNKILFSVRSNNSSYRDTVLVYDTNKEAWSIFKGWYVDSFIVFNNKLLFASSVDYSIYEAFVGYFDENNPYQSRFKTKRFSFGEFAFPKRCDKIFISGYISSGTKINVDILYNENGKLGKITKVIDAEKIYSSQISGSGWGSVEWGLVPFGFIQRDDIGFFRVYFDIPLSLGYSNIQLVIYSENNGGFWAIQNIGFNPIKVGAVPLNLVSD